MPTQSEILLISFSVIIPWIAVQIQLDMSQQLKMYSYSFNLTRKLQVDHNEDIIVFARVPKTATSSIMYILEHLTKKNNFTMFKNIYGMPRKRDVCIIILSFSASSPYKNIEKNYRFFQIFSEFFKNISLF